jgi:hypothetical protein
VRTLRRLDRARRCRTGPRRSATAAGHYAALRLWMIVVEGWLRLTVARRPRSPI